MKKFLLSVAALAMSFAASAQVDVQHQRVGVVDKVRTSHSKVRLYTKRQRE